jgi:adenylate cyclase
MPFEELGGLWVLFKARGPVSSPNDVVVIGIDENSERALQRPIDRSTHADLVRQLMRAGASVIVFDVFLHTESEDDDTFSAAIGEAGNVILAALLERDSRPGIDVQVLRTPVSSLATRAIGIAPWPVPEVFRVDWVFLRDEAARPTIPVVALQAYALEDFASTLRTVRPHLDARLPEAKTELVSGQSLERIMVELRRAFADDASLKADVLATDAAANPATRALVATYDGDDTYRTRRLYVNYYGPPRSILTVPYQDAITGAFEDGDRRIAGKAVFVGYSAQRQPGQRDDYPYVYTTAGFNLSGVELGATAFANLLNGNGLILPAFSLRAAIIVLWGFVIGAIFKRLRVRPAVLVGILLCVGYFVTALWAFRSSFIWLPIFVPALQFLFAAALSMRVEHLTDRVRLGVGTSEEAVLALTGRSKPEKVDHRVILFGDEQGSKKRLRRALAESDISKRRAIEHDLAIARDVPIAANGGRINHVLADSMLASWVTKNAGDTTDLAKQASAGCRAALAIHAGVRALNEKYPGSEVHLRLALDWGEISSHLNPSPEIKDWRMEGAPIHTAERLESLNKALGTSTLLSHAIACHLDKNVFHTQELGTFVFCDDSGDIVVDAVRVYELRAAGDVTDEEARSVGKFESALAALREQDWQTAATCFEELASSCPKYRDLASRYVTWCQQTLRETEARWRGTVMVTFSDKSQYLDRFI